MNTVAKYRIASTPRTSWLLAWSIMNKTCWQHIPYRGYAPCWSFAGQARGQWNTDHST